MCGEAQWRVIGGSVRGASHARSGLPNQDAIGWRPEPGMGLPLLVAVSDGHGSPRCFRSHIGAGLAVHTALETIQDLLDGQPADVHLSLVKRTAEERLAQELVRRWREAVRAHLDGEPFSPEEMEGLQAKDGARARQSVEKHPELAYGATLLTCLVTEGFLLFLQVGDGDILTVSDMGEAVRPLGKDERLFANETTSLCSRDAWKEARFGFQALAGSPPALIMLSTDGYSNSFREDAGFLKVGADMLDLVAGDGLDGVAGSLEEWLADASRDGSGDDITLAVICRPGPLERPRPAAAPEPAAALAEASPAGGGETRPDGGTGADAQTGPDEATQLLEMAESIPESVAEAAQVLETPDEDVGGPDKAAGSPNEDGMPVDARDAARESAHEGAAETEAL